MAAPSDPSLVEELDIMDFELLFLALLACLAAYLASAAYLVTCPSSVTFQVTFLASVAYLAACLAWVPYPATYPAAGPPLATCQATTSSEAKAIILNLLPAFFQ